jgi:hypothetical protein
MDYVVKDEGKMQIINKETGKIIYESDNVEILHTVDHVNRVTNIHINEVNTYQKYGVNYLSDDCGNPIPMYGVTDDWLIWELNHGNAYAIAESLCNEDL